MTLSSRIKKCFLVTCAIALSPQPAFAAPGGAMPWDQPMEDFGASLTGPVAKWGIMIAIVMSGLALAFSEGNAIWRKCVFVVFGGSIAFGAAAIVATLGGSA